MTTFIHTGDWQLGMTRHFLDDADAQPRFAAARIEAIASIGRIAEAEDAAFVVVCGDVFETNHVERKVVVRALEAMGNAGVPFYLLPGNHDPLDASSVFRSPTFRRHKPDNVLVLEGRGPVPTPFDVELVPAPWMSKRPLSDLVSAACRDLPPGGPVRVAVGHGAVDTLSPDPDQPAVIRLGDLEAALSEGRIHYVALGDRHSVTDVGATGRVWYAGAPEPTDYREERPGHVLVVRLGSDGIDVQPHAVGQWRFVQEDFELTGSGDLDRLDAWLSALPDKARVIVKLALVGSLSLRDKARLDQMLEHHADLLAALETWRRRSELVVLPDSGDLSEMGLSGFARESLDDLCRLAESGDDEAQVARDALGLLFRLGSRSS